MARFWVRGANDRRGRVVNDAGLRGVLRRAAKRSKLTVVKLPTLSRVQREDKLIKRWVRGDVVHVDRELMFRLAKAARKRGTVAVVRSGYRSRAEQQRLYDLYLAGRGAPANKPGTSLHEEGLAVDGSWENGPNFATTASDRALLERYGLRVPYAHEPWHVERA